MLDESRDGDGRRPESRKVRVVVVAAVALVAVVAVVLFLLPGRSTRSRSAASASCDTSKGTLVVGMVAPLSGPVSVGGLGMSHSAELAVDQANQRCAVPGYELALRAEDDRSTPQVADAAARDMAADPTVVGVVGTLNSSTAQAVQPIFDERGIVLVSPANTSTALTLGNDPATPARKYATYFRVCTTDLVQGPFAAHYLVQKAGKKRIAVIDDGTSYGAGLADEFAKEATRLGATVVARETVGQQNTEFSGVIAKIRPLDPDAVYYGGEYPMGGRLSGQLAGAGVNVPLMGGNGLVNPGYVGLGGRAGDLATDVGAPMSLPGVRHFVVDYDAAEYPQPPGTHGVFTYDATNVIINAVAAAVAGGTWTADTRRAVVRNVQATNTQGASGPISFDRYGDITNKLLTVYRVEGTDFQPLAGSTGSS